MRSEPRTDAPAYYPRTDYVATAPPWAVFSLLADWRAWFTLGPLHAD